jgi:replicative DNA helicase
MNRDLALESGLPASIELEKLVLGAVLAGTEFEHVAKFLQDADFLREHHRRIFGCMTETYKSGRPIGVASIALALQYRNQLQRNGVSYLADLSNVPTPLVNLDYYCRMVKQKAILRKTVSSCKTS